MFALNKFYHFLYGRKFILVTDHKPLQHLFGGPTKATPSLAANRLARWALMLCQYEYTIEYRKTADRGNADTLSRLPAGSDLQLDREESSTDLDCICTITTVNSQLNPGEAGTLAKETGKDQVLATVIRYTREGWSLRKIREEDDDIKTTVYSV